MHTNTPRFRGSRSRFKKPFAHTRPHSGGFSPRGARGGFSRTKHNRGASEFNVSRYIQKAVAPKVEEPYTPANAFHDFALSKELQGCIGSCGFSSPTPIQDQIITPILEGRDVVGLANTGTGKTGAFLIPLIEKTLADRTMQTLILAPTRELALQIEKELRLLSKGLRIFSVTCVGGVNIGGQLRALRQFNHFVIGTPGRVQDLIDRKALNLRGVRAVVLDEADRMLDMGFIGPIRSILKETPRERQTLFFSATMSREVEGLIHEFLKNPQTISVKKQDVAHSIEQDVVRYGSRDKFDVLVELLARSEFPRVLVFGRTKHGVERLAKNLVKRGIRASSIHGNKSHGQRQRALQDFKDGHITALIATDVAARGIHVDRISHVINYDLPQSHEDYIHRIGRTGRGAERGKALTFVP